MTTEIRGWTRRRGQHVQLAGVMLFVLLCIPTLVRAQSAISGVVRDGSGGVLPGVTVNAASPALIEKERSAVTDSQGRYSIVDLRPGIYSISFVLPGFSTLVRDTIELSSNATVPIDVQLRVGELAETITVTGATPLVDVENVQRTQVLTRDVIDNLPITRNSQSIGAVVPGVKMSRPDVGGSQLMEQVSQSTHGSLTKDITMQIDGMMVNSSMLDYSIQAYNDDALNQEVVIQTSAIPVDVGSGGIRINMIPKDGGNRLSGALYLGYTPGNWQSSNIDDELRGKGIRQPNGVEHVEDFNFSMGGPIMRDKLWFFGSARHMSVDEKVTNAFYPDGSPAIVDQYVRSGLARLTYQANQNNKISTYFQRIWKFKGHELTPGTEVVKASGLRDPKQSLYYVGQAKWTSTIGSNLLLETGFSTNVERLTLFYQPGIRQAAFTPSWYQGAAKQDAVLSTLTNAALSEHYFHPDMRMVSVILSRISGAHTLKAGMQWAFGPVGDEYSANADLVQVYRSGVPDSVNVYNTTTSYYTNVDANRGFFLQDTMRFKRATFNVGVRFDQLKTSIADISLNPSRFLPARSFGQDQVVDSEGNHMDSLPNFKDISPRMSVSYDLFGNARTAVKASYNEYVTAWSGGFANRYNPFTFASDQRSWRDTNGDDIAQDSEIGPSQNVNFGVRQSRFPSPDLSRENNVEYSTSIQHEVVPGISVLGAWFRRTYKNSEKSINELVDVGDYQAFTTPSPLDGSPVVIYNLNPSKQGQVRLVDTNSEVNRRTYDGFEVSFNARLPRAINLFGGWTSDRMVRVACDTNNPNLFRFCDEREYDIPYRSDFKLAGNLPLPWGMQISGIFMSYAGNTNNANPEGGTSSYLRNNWVVPATAFPNGQRTQSVTVNLIEPGTEYSERWNQLDLDGRKTFKVSNSTVALQLSVYNVLNTNTILTQNQNFGAALGQPLTILQGRMVRASLQMKF